MSAAERLAPDPGGFDLAAVVIDEMRRNPDPSPYVIAEAIVERLKPAQLREALALCLPLYVRTFGSRSIAPLSAVPDQGASDVQSTTVRSGRPHAEASADAKRAGQNRQRAWLYQRVSVGPRTYKFLGDFTREDCAAAAAVRRDHERRNADAAEWFETAEALLKKHRKATIADLPEGLLGAPH